MDNMELLELVNIELSKGKSLVSIGKDINISESAIRKRFKRLGYKRVNNQFVLCSDITDNITTNKVVKANTKRSSAFMDTTKEVAITSDITSNIMSNIDSDNIMSNIDTDKLNLLLEHIDSLLKLIPTTNTNTDVKSNQKVITTLRLDSGIYGAIKQRAKDKDINITDIVDKALLDYLNNYL